MSQDDLHNTAQVDTPQHVDIPNNTNGILLWLLGRFGVAVVFAASTFYVYQDMRADRKELFEAYKQNIEVMRDFKNALDLQGRQINDMRPLRNP